VDPIPLEPGRYSGTYKLVGGAASLDFVNTVSWPGTAREHDWLDRAANVTAWAQAAGLMDARVRRALDARPRAAAEKDLAAVRRIRDELRAVLWPLAHGMQPGERQIEALNARLREVSRARRIDPRSGRWGWVTPTSLPELLAPVIWDAARVLTEVDRSRLRHCPSCDWLFHDKTRNGGRRWCDMGDCGSRDKALRYYHRSRRE
jgi:predicted RNA-binding Zn ribbon-like protein